MRGGGESTAKIQEIAGHKDPMTTMRYTHARPKRKQEAVRKLRF